MSTSVAHIVAQLTEPQQRMLRNVIADGQRKYNGRAMRMIERLEALGLVDVDWDMDLVAKGNGVQGLWRITVKPKPGLEY